MAARGRGRSARPLSEPRTHRCGRDRPATGPRLFVGTPLSAVAAAEVAEIVEQVRSSPLPPAARDVRWVRLDGLHLTLRFLGPTPGDRLEATRAAVERAAHGASRPIEIEFGGAGTFPSGGRPRALWLGLTGGLEALADLASATEEALVDAGWQPQHRAFRPHLTLARSDGVAAGPLVAARLVEAMADRRIPCTIDTLGLFESITGGGPARYVAIDLHPLGTSSSARDPVYHQHAPDLSEVESLVDS